VAFGLVGSAKVNFTGAQLSVRAGRISIKLQRAFA
jgi:hypothetical protein